MNNWVFNNNMDKSTGYPTRASLASLMAGLASIALMVGLSIRNASLSPVPLGATATS